MFLAPNSVHSGNGTIVVEQELERRALIEDRDPRRRPLRVAQRAQIFRPQGVVGDLSVVFDVEPIVLGERRQDAPSGIDDALHPAWVAEAVGNRQALVDRLLARVPFWRNPPVPGPRRRSHAARTDVTFVEQHDLGTRARCGDPRPTSGHAAADDEDVCLDLQRRGAVE